MSKEKRKGFTLIELLVVIAVIGILATIVLVSLSTVQDKAKDTRIKATLGQIRALAEMEVDDFGNYAAVCADITPSDLYLDLATAGGTLPKCNNHASGWCVHVTTNLDGIWCADRNVVEKGSCGPLVDGIVCGG